MTRPLTEEQLRAKFNDCVRSASSRAADAVYAALRQLRHQPSAIQVAHAVVTLHNRQETDS